MMKIYHKQLGDLNKPHLVLIHGWGSNHKIWLPIMPKLLEHFSVSFFDLPGYGDNQHIRAESLEELSNIIYQAIYQNIPKQPAYWLGWSLGGLIASQVALNYPKAVKGLITVASSPCFLAQPQWSGLDLTIFEQFSHNLALNPIATLQRFITLQCLGDKQSKSVKNYLLLMLKSNDEYSALKPTLQRDLLILQQTDLREKMQSITLPHLSILGEQDKIVPYAIAPQLHNQKATFASSSHVPFLSDPDRFINVLADFVDPKFCYG